MSSGLLFGLGGMILMIAIGAMAVYGITYVKTRQYEQLEPGMDALEHLEAKSGTPV
jgi:hypothetical protein